MNYRKPSSRSNGGAEEVNITPVMNLFLVLIPFLLLAAEFVQLAVLELNLPTNTRSVKSDGPKDDKPLILIMLAINEKGFQVKAPRMKKMPIGLKESQFQFVALSTYLKQVKARYPDTEEITIQPTDYIEYETIVHTMDACRDNGFPNVSISAVKS